MSQFVTLNPGDRIADHLSLAVDRGQLRKAGYRASAVYLKALTPAFIKQAGADRWPLVIIFEQSATAGLQGANAGAADGTNARAKARSLGIPDDVEIICASFDYDVTAANLAPSTAYAHAFAQTAGPSGRYGDRDLIDAAAPFGGTNWQMASGWFSRLAGIVTTHPLAHVKQSPSIPFFGGGIDPNLVLRPLPVWLPDAPVAPPAPPVYDPAHNQWGLFPLNGAKPSMIQGTAQHAYVHYVQDVIFFKAGGNIARDGNYGPQTEKRLLDVKSIFNISEWGVGPQTWGAIDYLAGH